MLVCVLAPRRLVDIRGAAGLLLTVEACCSDSAVVVRRAGSVVGVWDQCAANCACLQLSCRAVY